MTSKKRINPAMIDPDFENDVNKGLALKDAEDYEGALKIFQELNKRHPDYPPVLGMLGGVYRLLGNLNEALPILRKTVQLSPKSKLASIMLFHTLYDLDDIEGAFQEMKRFLSNSNSEDYEMIMQEVNDRLAGGDEELEELLSGSISGDYKQLIIEINKLLNRWRDGLDKEKVTKSSSALDDED